MSSKTPEELAAKIYECLTWWGTFPEPHGRRGDDPENYERWDDLLEMAEAILDPNWKHPLGD